MNYYAFIGVQNFNVKPEPQFTFTERQNGLEESRFGQALYMNAKSSHIIIGAPTAPNGGNVWKCSLRRESCLSVFKKDDSFSQSGMR